MPKKSKSKELESPETPANKHTFFHDDKMPHVRRKPLHKMSAAERTWATSDTTEEFIKPVNKFDVYKVTVKNTPKEVIKKGKKKKNKNEEEDANTSSQKDTSDTENVMEGNPKGKKKKDKKKKLKEQTQVDNSDCSSTNSQKSKKGKKRKIKEVQVQERTPSERKDDSEDEELDLEEYGDIVNKVKNIICNTSENNDNNCEENEDDVIEIMDIADDIESEDSDIVIVDLNTGNDDNNLKKHALLENYDLNPFSIKFNGNNMDYVYVSGFMVLKADGECLKKLRALTFEKKVTEKDYMNALELAVSNGNKLIDSSTKIICINCKQYGHYSFGCTYDPDEEDIGFEIVPEPNVKKVSVGNKYKLAKKKKRST